MLCQPGLYRGFQNRNLTFTNGSITIESEHGPQTCIVDCESRGRFLDCSGNRDALINTKARDGNSNGDLVLKCRKTPLPNITHNGLIQHNRQHIRLLSFVLLHLEFSAESTLRWPDLVAGVRIDESAVSGGAGRGAYEQTIRDLIRGKGQVKQQ